MKIANVEDWKTDESLVEGGAPCDIGEDRVLFVKRAGTRNRTFMAAVAGINTQDEASAMQVFARTIVVGWRGLRDDQGKDVAFTSDECVELFRTCPEIFAEVALFAARRANFRAEQLEVD